MNDAAEPLVLTPDEARPLTRLSRNAFYDALKRGDVPSIRVGKRYLIPRAKFNKWLAGDLAEAS